MKGSRLFSDGQGHHISDEKLNQDYLNKPLKPVLWKWRETKMKTGALSGLSSL